MTKKRDHSVLDYYVQQSQIADPGKYAHLYDDLPRNIQGLSGLSMVLSFLYYGKKHTAWIRLVKDEERSTCEQLLKC